MKARLLAGLALLLLATPSGGASPATSDDHPVIELRQYKIVAGKRDAMIALFEQTFVESQEAVGARLIGQFRDMDDPNRFTWIRGFPDMAERPKALGAFYHGPIWQAHRDEANAMLDDNDNVLLLRPAWTGSGFGPADGSRAAVGAGAPPGGVVVATVYYLWKNPEDGFSAFFRGSVAPRLRAAGLPVLGAYVAEEQANNFPRLPVREGEKVFVWFSRVERRADFAQVMDGLAEDAGWRRLVAPGLADAQERPAQILHLAPAPRSLLR
ncbi:NIPSNAP family protein [Rhizorhabdus histidinilytica]|uniref:NIPSNAP family protein n=1 Tax=Rhizorhabdus histidinilytica TaxID=439228 RepID=UPI00321FE3D4